MHSLLALLLPFTVATIAPRLRAQIPETWKNTGYPSEKEKSDTLFGRVTAGYSAPGDATVQIRYGELGNVAMNPNDFVEDTEDQARTLCWAVWPNRNDCDHLPLDLTENPTAGLSRKATLSSRRLPRMRARIPFQLGGTRYDVIQFFRPNRRAWLYVIAISPDGRAIEGLEAFLDSIGPPPKPATKARER